jgi:hypothetical protein
MQSRRSVVQQDKNELNAFQLIENMETKSNFKNKTYFINSGILGSQFKTDRNL